MAEGKNQESTGAKGMTFRPAYRGRTVRRMTEIGLEKLCPGCKEWWPQSNEFYTWIATRNHYHNKCRACLASDEAARRNNRKAA